MSFSYASVTYTWLRNGTLLDDDDVNIIISTDSDEDNNSYTTTLMILDVQLSDNGVYVCNVTNRRGAALSNAASLSVISKLRINIGYMIYIYYLYFSTSRNHTPS